MTLIFLHGIGQDSQSWQEVINHLPSGDFICLDLLENGRLPAFSVMQERVRALIRKTDDEVVLVGLSLGAMLALSILESPEPNLAGVVPIAGQYQFTHNIAYKLQVTLVKYLPKVLFAKQGLDKGRLLAFYQELANLDMTDVLKNCPLPVLVLCGSRDKINLKVAEELAQLLPKAQFEVIAGAGHEVNKANPKELAAAVTRFITHLSK